jgi:hypothetical protein
MNPQNDYATADVEGTPTDRRPQPDQPMDRMSDGRVDPGSGQARAESPHEDARHAVRDEKPNHAPLFATKEATDLRKRWADVQAGFVDEPRHAVEQADSLVSDVLKRLADQFAGERSGLEKQWDGGSAVTTEDLRLALQRYRSFFDRLLTI